MPKLVTVGQRLSYKGDLCTVRYVGPIDGTEGQWLGVEWDDGTRGKHDGQAGGQRYFQCQSRSSNAASFIRPNRQSDPSRTFLEALYYKYAPNRVPLARAVVDTADMRADAAIVISGKIVEEVGFDKVAQQFAQLDKLRIVILDSLCIRGTSPSATTELARIRNTCPNIGELDLSRNLLQSWQEIMPILEQFPRLHSFKADGNRFSNFVSTVAQREQYSDALAQLQALSLGDTLLRWSEICELASLCPTLTTLNLAGNALSNLPLDGSHYSLPSCLTEINLERNDLKALADLESLRPLPNLRKLILKSNAISEATVPAKYVRPFHDTLVEVDLSRNAISSWSFIDSLPLFFPGLTALRISNNPLYNSLRTPDGLIALTPEDGYMLTIGRLKHLTSLNYSDISDKDRLNAETYYLGSISTELALASFEDESAILRRHPRWDELCEVYGQPNIVRKGANRIHPDSLEARLLTCHFRMSPWKDAQNNISATVQSDRMWTTLLPKSLSMYAVYGLAGRNFGLPPSQIELIWETGEPLRSLKTTMFDNDDESVRSWDSEEVIPAREQAHGINEGGPPFREVRMPAGTRSLGISVEGPEVTIRVERAS